MILAIDLDGTITRDDLHGSRLMLREGARETLMAAAKAGHELVLHSTRWHPTDGSKVGQTEARAFLKAQGLLGLFKRFEAKPFAHRYLDARAVQIGDGNGGTTSWFTLGDWYGSDLPGEVVDSAWPRLFYYRAVGPMQFSVVDGVAIRGNKKLYGIRDNFYKAASSEVIPFTEGANFCRYPWVAFPEGYIDSGDASDEWDAIAAHEAFEAALMLLGFDYTNDTNTAAHDHASTLEAFMRAHSDATEACLVRLGEYLTTIVAAWEKDKSKPPKLGLPTRTKDVFRGIV